ncbi:distal tail protein Dit [Macrococcus carouselicus]|uniref:Siphovirus-type tail component C-terminal domain-containing protein n=1 Tax=Macrococcus carouselicus TaxID=69969 RepID=A0A9Q8FNR3_9STAP|nr:distal tail protein Dit [Macrococcus carouselicus]TDM04070.1 hypothetical protein ERX40_02560 [Macrococcus carouselicus]
MRTIIINEKKLDHLYLGKDFDIPSFPIDIESVEVSGRAGAVFTNRKIKTIDLEIPVVYQNVHNLPSKEVNDLMINFFNYDDEISIQIEDEDWYWLGYITGEFKVSIDTQPFYNFNIKITLLNPYKYSIEEYSNIAVKDQVAINNTGTVELYPIIEAKALKDTSYFMVAKNNDDYIMLGEAPTANKKSKKINPSVLRDDLETTTGWSYVSNPSMSFADNETGGMLGAHIHSTGYGFGVDPNTYPNYIDRWNGGAVKKPFSRNIQNFEHKCIVKVTDINQTVNKFGTGKVFTHLWDEAGNLVAAIGLVDASYTTNDLTVIAKLFDETGSPYKVFSFKQKYDAYLDDFVHMSIKREGNKWEFRTNTIKYVKTITKAEKARYGLTRELMNNRHVEHYTDKSRKYMKPIRTASIYIAQFNWENKSAIEFKQFRANAYFISTNELFPKTDTEVDEFIEKGDKIIIDNYNQKMIMNKKDVTKYKDFGSNYFSLEKGQHELLIYPTKAFNVTVRWEIVDY